MSRKIFAEDLDLNSLLLPFEEFVPFYDRGGFKLNPENKDAAVAVALPILEKKYDTLYSTEFLMFKRDGNRSIYEKKYFERRNDLTTLTAAEALEGEGRFIDKILDLVWMILEESTWVLPAHIHPFAAPERGLPIAYEGRRKFIDLFAAQTGAVVSAAWYVCHEKFDEISPVISKRILENLNDRIIDCFVMEPKNRHWMNGWWVNNWCPWILSNILTATALTPTTPETRVSVVEGAIAGLEKFMGQMGEDGACDEGPMYWRAASGAVYNAALVIRDMSGGRIDIFKDEKVRRMGEFYPDMYIANDRFLNFSDARPHDPVVKSWGYDWGLLSSSDVMKSFWAKRCKEPEFFCHPGNETCYRFFYRLCGEKLDGSGVFTPKTSIYYESLKLGIMREYPEEEKGFYIAMLGGHNTNAHTHGDLGNVYLFADGEPIFIDAGTGTYTKRSFSAERDNLWWIRSDHHNVPTVNGKMQGMNGEFAAKDPSFDASGRTFSLELSGAYPKEAELESYRRTIALRDGVALTEDTVVSKIDGEISFNYLLNAEPQIIEDGVFTVRGKKICYDKRLTLEVDCPDLTMPETVEFPQMWGCERLYRVRLSSPLAAGKRETFVLTVGN